MTGILRIEWDFGFSARPVRTMIRASDSNWWRKAGAIETTIGGIWKRYRELRAELAPKPHIKLRHAA